MSESESTRTTADVAAPERRSVLVAEDHDDTRFLLRYMLEAEGYRVVEAANGKAAVEIAVREKPDLILMDLTLPVLDGLTATLRIHETPSLRSVPVVALSGHDPDCFREAADAAGCAAYLYKPVDSRELKATIQEHLCVAQFA